MISAAQEVASVGQASSACWRQFVSGGAAGHGIVWRLPLYNTVHNILTNPVHAGAYAFGRTMSKVSVEDGRKRVKRGLRRPQTEWDVLLKDRHEGYITWSEFERTQCV